MFSLKKIVARIGVRIVVLGCISLLGCSSVFAQNLEQFLENPELKFYHIENIELIGNEHTRAFVILREMQTRENSQVTAVQLEQDRRRIQSLGLFNRVEMFLLKANKGYTLQIVVTERWYIFPYPIFFRNDKDWSKFSYGVGIIHTNFRGRRELLDLQGYLGYSKRLSLNYSIPWLVPRWQIYAALRSYTSQLKSKNISLEQVNEIQQSFAGSIGKRFGRYIYLDGSLAYTRFKTDPKGILPTLSSSGLDKWLTYFVSFRYDSRDLYEFPSRGLYLSTYWRKSGRHGDVINYSFAGVDFRKYFPLPWQMVFALRSDLEISRGQVPYYRHLYLGYSERIRGYFYEEFEGENRLVGSAELRFPIRKITYHSIFQDTPFAEYYRNLKFGVSGGIFVDVGKVWYRKDGFSKQNLLKGFGLGLFFHVPYADLVRLEYAFDANMNGQLILFDLGVAF